MPSKGRSTVRKQRALTGEVLLDEKSARRLRRIRWRRIATAIVPVLVFAALVGIYFSPVLRVQQVEVTGTQNVTADEVRDLIALEGVSLLHVNLEKAQKRVAVLPLVQSVTLERDWPQTVRVHVTERQPWGFWQVGDEQYVIDSEGFVLPDVAAPEGAMAIRDLGQPSHLIPGDYVDRDAVQLTRTLLEQVPARLAMNVAHVEFSPATGLAVITDAGYRVVIGDSQNMDHKLAVWQAIEQELGRETMAGHLLDLRFGDRPSFQ